MAVNATSRRADNRNAEYCRRKRARRRGEYVEPLPRRKLSVDPGERFGKLTVIREIPDTRPRRIECTCDCGAAKVVLISNLVRGQSKSCGCVSAAKIAARNKSSEQRALITKHGLCKHPLWSTWNGMMARCYNEEHVGFKNYGARGITVCEQWHDPVAYVNWVEQNLGPRPDGCTMDRINNDLGYQPGNLQWAARSQQTKNRRPDVMPKGSDNAQAVLTEDIVRECRARWATGETQQELAAEYGVSKPTMHKAITGKTWQHVSA